MANEVSVEITIEEKAALRALTRLSKGIDSTTRDASKSVKKMDMAFASFAGNIAADFAGKALGAATSAVKDFVGGAVDAAAQVEKLQTQFQILTGDTKVAADLFQELTDFSASTPFQLNNIAEAGAQLLSFGFAADSVTDRIRKIGDVAAGSNSDLKEVSLIYGQVAAAGKLTGERLLQFQERAIPIGPAIAKTMGVAESSVKDMVSKGKVGFAEFETAFNSMSATGGMFAGAIDKQSKTVNGALSTMSDNFDIMQAALGKAFAPAVVDTAGELSGVMQELTKAFADNGPAIAKTAGILAELLIIKPSKFIADFFTEDTAADKVQNLDSKIKELNEDLRKLSTINGKVVLKGRERSIRAEILALEEKRTLEKLIQDEQRKFAGKGGLDTDIEKEKEKVEAVADPKADARVLKERAVMAEIEMIRAEQDIALEERKLLEKEAAGLATEEDLIALQDIEAQKLNIKAIAEQEKVDLIKDANERKLAEEKLIAQTSLDFQKLETKNSIAELKRRQLLEQQIGQAKLQTAQNFMSAGLTLAKEGSSTQKALLSAQALMSTYSAAAQAIAAPPGPPWSFALAASTVAMGLANVAKINGVGFANGGVIGGFVGATPGQDNTMTPMRKGEMVLTSTDQKTLFDNIRNGDAGKQENSGAETMAAMLSQPIIIQIDNKEIARATRDAQRDGFQVAS